MYSVRQKKVMTLDRALSRFGLASRTEARQAIEAGRLKVNGAVTRDPDRWVDPARDVLHLDGNRVKPARRLYLVFYKPKGVVTTHGDPAGRPTVYDYLHPRLRWVAPVGRLDKDTSGVLLLTNDTEFAHAVTSPASKVEKRYRVKLNGLISDGTLTLLAQGVRMKRGDMARPHGVSRLEDRGKYSWIEVVLTEGKNREVRRMMEALGFSVLKLVRTHVGPVSLADLQIGSYRELTSREIRELSPRRT
jgi:pseudouridine synthase